jgi:hypothetical protein
MAQPKDSIDSSMQLERTLEVLRLANDLGATSDAEGRFRLTGIGRERIVSLWIEGPTIVTSLGEVHARTRPGPISLCRGTAVVRVPSALRHLLWRPPSATYVLLGC